MQEPNDNPAVTEETRPAAAPTLEGKLDGSLMNDLRAMVEERVNRIVSPPTEQPASSLDLSENDRDYIAEQEQRHEAELDRLTFERDLAVLAQQDTRSAELVRRILDADTIEDLFGLVREGFSAQPEPEAEVAQVDRNNPFTSNPFYATVPQDMLRLPDGRLITREQGLEILRQAPSIHG